MSIAIEENSAADADSDSRKKQLRKTFNLLKTHASAVANFTLQWQDLEDHFLYIQNSIQSKLEKLQPLQNPSTLNAQLQSQSKSKEVNLAPAVEPKSQSSETQLKSLKALAGTEQSSPENTSFNGIPVRDGKALLELVFLNEHLKERSSLRGDILDALKASSNSGKLVLEAVSGFFPSETKTEGNDSVVSGVRRSCLLLLEEFLKLKFVVSPQLREEAKKLALEWKGKMKVQPLNPSEVWGFLLLLGIYGLIDEFDKDEILKLFGSVVQRKQAPEVFMYLGYADKASDLIEQLISEKKQPDAVRFIYAFELVDKFPPVPLLQAHLNQFEKVATAGSKKEKNSRKSQDDTTKKEVNAVRSVIRCIESYNLGSQYSPDTLRKRIDWLMNQKKENKTAKKETTTKTPSSQSQVQKLTGKKRAASDSKNQSNNQNRKKNPRTVRTAPAPTASNYSLSTTAAVHHRMHHQSPHQPAVLYERQDTRYLIPSGEMVAPAPADPIAYRTASNLYHIEASHHQPAGSYTDHGAQYSAVQYSLARSIPDTYRNLSSGTYGSGGSHTQHVNLASAAFGLGGSPVAQHGSLTSGAYRLTGSIPVNPRTSPTASHYELIGSGSVNPHVNSLVQRYEQSIDGSGRQYGSSGLPTSMGVASDASASLNYYPTDRLRISSYDDRPAPLNGYNVLPTHYQSIYRL